MATWVNLMLMRVINNKFNRLNASGSALVYIFGTTLGTLIDKRSHALFLFYFLVPKCLELIMLSVEQRNLITRRFCKNILLPLTKAATMGILALYAFNSPYVKQQHEQKVKEAVKQQKKQEIIFQGSQGSQERKTDVEIKE